MLPNETNATLIDVLLAQAPTGSVNPKTGDKMGKYLHAFHAAVVFRQNLSNTEARYWTLEYDSRAPDDVGFAFNVPYINGSNLTWGDKTKAGYCLIPRIFWGRDHWKTTWELAMTLTAQQVRRTFTDAVLPINQSNPQFQVMSVEGPHGENWVPHQTCGDGARWFLYYASTIHGVPVRSGFRFYDTRLIFLAESMELVDENENDEAWQDVVNSYRRMDAFFSAPKLSQKFLDFIQFMPIGAIYDAPKGVYYRITKSFAPFVRTSFEIHEICSPPWSAVQQCLKYRDVPGVPTSKPNIPKIFPFTSAELLV